MAAPKGNKNAMRGISPKDARYLLKISRENLDILKEIASKEKTSIAQVIEKSLLASYPSNFDGKF